MNRKEIEAEFHRRIKSLLTKKQQGYVMGELRAVLDEADLRKRATAADVEAYLTETKDRIYGLRDGE